MSTLRGRSAARRIAIVALVVGAVTGSVLVQPAVADAAAELMRAPYLTDVTATSVTVNWATTSKTKGIVKYGSGTACASTAVQASTTGTKFTVTAAGTDYAEYQNSVALTGLSTGTGYCYRIYTGDSTPIDLLGTGSTPSFTTLASENSSSPVTFAVFADWGDTTNSGVNDGLTLNSNAAALMAQIQAAGTQFGVTIGDVAYPGGTQSNYGDLVHTGKDISAVFGPSYWAGPGQSTPLFVASGNHGRNSNYLTNWPTARTAAASAGVSAMVPYPTIDGATAASYPTSYYAFTTGGTRFYVLDAAWSDGNVGTATGGACGTHCKMYEVDHDAHWTTNSAEYLWLANDLAAHPGGLKLALFHYPLRSDDQTEPGDTYLQNTPGSSGSLEQLLHDGGVKLAFSGHAHTYQRNVAPPGGLISYVSGGGGAKLTTVSKCASTDAYALGWSYSSNKGSACGAATPAAKDGGVFHFLKVTVSGSSVSVVPINSAGQAFDPVSYDFGADAIAPSAPANPLATLSGTTKAVLTWGAATDNRGIAEYDVYRNGVYLATVPGTVLTFTDATVVAGSSYTYRIDARDLADQATGASASLGGSGTTDTTAPSSPAGLAASGSTQTTVGLSWSPSTDNVAVTGYNVLRGGLAIGSVTSPTTSFTDTGLVPGTAYSYQVQAKDAAGNLSTISATLDTATLADSTPTAGSGFSDGFESGDTSAWTPVVGLGVQSAIVHTGGFSARETSTGDATYAYKTLPSSNGELWAQAWVYVASRSTSVNLIGFRTSGGASIVNLYVDTNGRISVRNNIGSVTTYSTATMPLGSWHRMVLHAAVNGTAGSVSVTMDGATVPGLSLTGQNLGTGLIAKLQLGETATARTYDIVLDDVAVSTQAL